ncbi:TrkA family potassium uptake protein [Paenibacillus cisolokensis]|uniref:Potassium transporter Trk n=1 Tax=Paenibacillus cisolokensis TaxID=1658519 RepID=A0ABQ4N9E5_9BACL|nr:MULTISPECIES: TrkA family potassium uptake protein [Paenibacillus]ALS26788.1 potassium uptake system protein [Paenibacillus sp. 32O-W]GIQ64859.1 potassium transporter Trk [Paenibacillus cisolokensis]
MKMNQFVIIGLGRFGSSLGRELVELGYEVLGIDKDEEAVEEMSDVLTHAVVADSTDEDVLRSLGVRNFDCAVVAIGNDIQANIMTSILIKDLGVKQVVVKALGELHGRVLEKIGVDRIIYPERDMGVRVAHQLVSPNLLDYIELSKEYTIAELAVPKEMSGKTLKELNPRARYGCSIVAINKLRGGIIIAPTAADVLEEKDIMVVIGTNEQIENFEAAVSR